MVNVIFDANIFFGPIKDLENASYNIASIKLEEFRDLLSTSQVKLCFNFSNFIEFLLGVNLNSFATNVGEARILSSLISDDSLLERPVELTIRECKIFLGDKSILPFEPSVVTKEKMVSLIVRLAQSRRWEDFKEEIEKAQSPLFRFKSEQPEFNQRLAQVRGRPSKQLKMDVIKNWRISFVRMMEVLGLPKDILSQSPDTVFKNVFSLRYQFAAYLGNTSKRSVDGGNIGVDDYVDIEQAAYLSVVDYWVTNDRGGKVKFGNGRRIKSFKKRRSNSSHSQLGFLPN